MKHLILLSLFCFSLMSIVAQDCSDVSFEILNPSNIATYGSCVNSDFSSSFSLVGTPKGGVFSGVGVNENTFDTSTLTSGQYEIIYTVEIDGTQCSFSQPFNMLPQLEPLLIDNNGLPVVDVCPNSTDTLSLESSDFFGIFYGDGVDQDNATFIPSLAECGENEINYFTTIDGINCQSTITINADCVYVTNNGNPLPNPSPPTCWDNNNLSAYDNLFIIYNSTDGEITIEPDGITFDEETGQILFVENEGVYTIHENATINGEECTTSFNLSVVFVPELYLTMDTIFCLNDEAVEITGNQPLNGVYTSAYLALINETSQTQIEYLNPAFWGIGEYELTYFHSDSLSGCPSVLEQKIYIIEDPIFNLSETQINTYDEPIPLVATPNYGSFSGDGVIVIGGDYYFDPTLSNEGNVDITYTLSEFDPCGPMTLTQSIEVMPPGVNTQDWDNNFQVNIQTNHIQITSDQLLNEPLQIDLYNIQGQRVYQAKHNSLQQIQIPLPEQKNQLYVLSITSDNGRFIRSISLIK